MHLGGGHVSYLTQIDYISTARANKAAVFNKQSVQLRYRHSDADLTTVLKHHVLIMCLRFRIHNAARIYTLDAVFGLELYELLSADPEFEARLSRPTPDTQLGTSNASSLRIRVDQANAWDADYFISIHTNASSLPAATGSEALVYTDPSVAASLATDILRELNIATGLRNRGVLERPGLYVLRRTEMPAVLVELGFISNAGDAELMNNRPDLFALGIYRGIRDYLGL